MKPVAPGNAARFEVTTTTTAPLPRVWAALVDVADWPRWMASYGSVRRLDEGPLRVGSRARVKQPWLAPAVWEVTDLTPERGFTWAASAAGVRTVGRHRLAPEPGGGTRIALDVTQTGPPARLLGLVLGPLIRRYVRMEADGLRAAAEAADTGT
jgi:uncharacterized protein YndB with AHSA1/START domain